MNSQDREYSPTDARLTIACYSAGPAGPAEADRRRSGLSRRRIDPYKTLPRDLRASGFQVMLSLELFNRQYWKEDPLTVARTGLQKMKALVGASEQESS